MNSMVKFLIDVICLQKILLLQKIQMLQAIQLDLMLPGLITLAILTEEMDGGL